MKKYLAILTAIIAVTLSSCSNEDVQLLKNTTFKINPSTVISGFEEFQPGELTEINKNFQLRVQLYIYNDKGQLVNDDIQFFSDYAHIMTSNLDIEQGKSYTAVAITDIISRSDSFEYWEITDKDNLSTLKISNTGYLGSQKNILGISNYDFIGGESSQINIDVQPAGTLMIVYYAGIRAWSNVTDYQLGINRHADYVTFTTSAQPEWNIEASTSFDWRISHIEVADWDDSPEINNIYDYVFTLPYGSTKIEFEAKTSSGWQALTSTANLTLGRGSEYFVYCDIEEQEISIEQLTDSRAGDLNRDFISNSNYKTSKQNNEQYKRSSY